MSLIWVSHEAGISSFVVEAAAKTAAGRSHLLQGCSVSSMLLINRYAYTLQQKTC